MIRELNVLLLTAGVTLGSAAPGLADVRASAGRQLSPAAYEYLRQGYRADAPEYAALYRDSWPYVRYPVKKADLCAEGLVVADNVRLKTSPDRAKIVWGAVALDPSVVKDVYVVFNSFNLGSDDEYAKMEAEASEGVLSPQLLSLLTRVAPIYLRTRLGATPDDPAAVRRELVRLLVGHAQVYFEFYPDCCVVGDGRGSVKATPGLVISYDARGKRRQKYDPFAGMDERAYDALYDFVEIGDALRWSTTSDTSTTFFRLNFDQGQKRRLLERMLGIALGEQPLTRFDDGRPVNIAEHRYHLLYHSCINTSMRLVNEQLEPGRRLPEAFDLCDGLSREQRSGNEICDLFNELRLPSSETSVFGVVGNALEARGLAKRLPDYPANLRRIIDEASDIDVRPRYPTLRIITPPRAAGGATPSLGEGLNLTGGD